MSTPLDAEWLEYDDEWRTPMSEMPSEGKGSTVAPGMTQVVEAGTIYEITDEKGVGIEIEARDNPVLVSFLYAFDEWVMASNSGEGRQEDLRRLYKHMMELYHALPPYLKRDLPSAKRGGVVL